MAETSSQVWLDQFSLLFKDRFFKNSLGVAAMFTTKMIKPNLIQTNVKGLVAFTSYETLVAVYDKTSGVFYETNRWYSRTTTRHLGLAKKELGNPASVQPTDPTALDAMVA